MVAGSVLITGEMLTSLVGKEIVAESASAVNSTIGKIIGYGCEYITQMIEELDIHTKLQVIEEFVKEIPKTDSKSVHICLDKINCIIKKIHEELEVIEKEMEYHKTRWFYYYRSPNCYIQVDNLRKHSGILDKRVDTLFKILKF